MKEYCDHMGLFHTATHVVFEVSTIKELPKPVTFKGKEYAKIRAKEVHRGMKLNERCKICERECPTDKCASSMHSRQMVQGWIGSFLNSEHFNYNASINWTGEKYDPMYETLFATSDQEK